MSNLLLLNSRNSTNPTEPSKSQFILDLRLNNMGKSSISLEFMSFQNLVYPINRYYNTIVVEEDDGSETFTITLPERLYTATELATQLQTLLNAGTLSSYTYTVSYTSNRGKLSISLAAGNFRFTQATTCLYQLGLPATGMTSFQGPSAYEFNYPVRLDGTAHVDVISSLPLRNISTDGKSNILTRIYLNVPFGNLVKFQATNPIKYYLNSESLNTINFSLFDDQGNPWLLPENSQVDYMFNLTF